MWNAKGQQLNAAIQGIAQREAGESQDVREHEVQGCMSLWNSSISLNIKYEACPL